MPTSIEGQPEVSAVRPSVPHDHETLCTCAIKIDFNARCTLPSFWGEFCLNAPDDSCYSSYACGECLRTVAIDVLPHVQTWRLLALSSAALLVYADAM